VLQSDAKVSLSANLTRKLSNYGGPVFAVTGPPRQDEFRSLQVGLNWTPLRALTLSASFEHDRRDSSVLGFQFTDNVATFNASATF